MTATDAALAHPELAESAAQRYEAHLEADYGCRA